MGEKLTKATQDVHEAECRYDQVETENARMRFQMQEVEAQRDKLVSTGKEFDRAEDKYKIEIERLSEKMTQIQIQYDKAKPEKERIELESLKLQREHDKIGQELRDLKALKEMEDMRGAAEILESERMVK